MGLINNEKRQLRCTHDYKMVLHPYFPDSYVAFRCLKCGAYMGHKEATFRAEVVVETVIILATFVETVPG